MTSSTSPQAYILRGSKPLPEIPLCQSDPLLQIRIWLNTLPQAITGGKEGYDKENKKCLPAKTFKLRQVLQQGRILSHPHVWRHVCITLIVLGLVSGALYGTSPPGYPFKSRLDIVEKLINFSSLGFDVDEIFFFIPHCQSGSLYNGKLSFIGIDIQLGRLSFAQAKVIDVVWNWTAGRGVQGLLVFFSYQVFTDALVRVAESSHVPYGIFTSLALLSAKTDTLWHLSRGIFTLPGRRMKFILVWLFVSTVYLAFFPTFIDLMTGYEASNLTQMILPHNTTINVTEVFLLDIQSNRNNSYNYLSGPFNVNGSSCYDRYWYDETLQASWSQQVLKCNKISQLRDFGEVPRFYMALPSSYQCAIEPNIYHWGFSTLWTQLFVYITSVWLLGLLVLWLDAEYNSQMCRFGRYMGMHRAILDISEAIKEDLGNETCAYSEAELAAAVKKLDPIKYYVSVAEESQVAHIGLSSRKSQKVKLEPDRLYGRK